MDRAGAPTDEGFTLIEVIIGAFVLVTGILGVLGTIQQTQTTTWSVHARSGGTALVREVIEGAHEIPYDQLVTANLVDELQSQGDLADDDQTTAGWQIRRNHFTYTVSVGVCAIDDPRDGTGGHPAGVFCASNSGGTTPAQCQALLSRSGLVGLPGETATAASVAGLGDCGLDVNGDGQVDGLSATTGTTCAGACADINPADAKRIVVLVRWDRGLGSRWVLQAATVPNPGLAGAPSISALSTSTTRPITSAATTQVPLTATTSANAATVGVYLDGTQVTTATGSGTAWSWTWPLGTVSTGTAPNADEVVDGTYLLGMKAFDGNGQFGSARSLTVIVNRRAPYPPQGLLAGRNGTAVELDWEPNPERDIEAYRGWRLDGTSWTLVCTATTTRCQDPSPPASGSPQYAVSAVDRDGSGIARDGARSSAVTVPDTNTAPGAPTALTATTVDGNQVLTWQAPAAGDPDPGDRIDHYVIYRDGQQYADRYDTTINGSTLTYTDTAGNGIQHTYWVAAVDTHLAESTMAGPVVR